MQLLSSFELSVQPITPARIANMLGLPNPVSVQAYFLLISNPGDTTALIQLDFTANPNTDGASNLNGGGTVPADEKTNFQAVTSFINTVLASPLRDPNFIINNDSSATAAFSVPALGTALFLLQPDVSPLRNFDKTTEEFNYQVRGYVKIGAMPGVTLLCSPQVRGTFFELGEKGELLAPMILQPEAQRMESVEERRKLSIYSQQAYSLPTANSGLYIF
jgi:hypothetical protein